MYIFEQLYIYNCSFLLFINVLQISKNSVQYFQIFTTMSFESRYNNLNPKQKLAVDTIFGPVLVIA